MCRLSYLTWAVDTVQRRCIKTYQHLGTPAHLFDYQSPKGLWQDQCCRFDDTSFLARYEPKVCSTPENPGGSVAQRNQQPKKTQTCNFRHTHAAVSCKLTCVQDSSDHLWKNSGALCLMCCQHPGFCTCVCVSIEVFGVDLTQFFF